MIELATPEELRRITGRVRASAQRKWLSERGVRHERDADGRPIVARAVIAKLLGVRMETKRAAESEPDVEALRAALGGRRGKAATA